VLRSIVSLYFVFVIVIVVVRISWSRFMDAIAMNALPATFCQQIGQENRRYSPRLPSRHPRIRVSKMTPVLNSTTKVATAAAFSYCPATMKSS